jgi:hypothetical protein
MLYIAPCPVGQYSRTGYNVNGCTSCPVNFYQDQTGQMTCKVCSDSSKTLTSGSTKSDDCIAITDGKFVVLYVNSHCQNLSVF